MKHGDKAKSKASKASGKKASSKEAGSKGSKAGASLKSKTSGESKAAPKASSKTAGGKTTISKTASGGNGKNPPVHAPEQITFTNSVVGNAFKRAVKKYPNAFRRLTD